MPVATYQRPGELIGPKDFPAPKRASELKYWYKGIAKFMKELPQWEDRFASMASQVEVDVIVFDLPEGTLFIARKRHLR